MNYANDKVVCIIIVALFYCTIVEHDQYHKAMLVNQCSSIGIVFEVANTYFEYMMCQ